MLCHTQANENDEALPDPPLWRVVRASAPEWYLIVIGVLASAADGATFPVISVFMGRLFEVGIKICQISVIQPNCLFVSMAHNLRLHQINHIFLL